MSGRGRVANLQDANGRPVAGAERGNARALTHGVWSATVLAPRAGEIAIVLREALGAAYGQHVEPMVAVAALALARLERAQADLDAHGLTDERGELRPLVKVIGNLQAEARRSLEALALSPREWARAGLDHARGQALAEHLKRNYREGV